MQSRIGAQNRSLQLLLASLYPTARLYFYRQWEGEQGSCDTGINIVITYGNINNVHDHLFMDGGTMLTITGVHFTGVAQAIGPNRADSRAILIHSKGS